MDPLNALHHTLDPASQHLFNMEFINSELSTCHCWQDPQDPGKRMGTEESLCVPMNMLPMVSKLENGNNPSGRSCISDTKLEVVIIYNGFS